MTSKTTYVHFLGDMRGVLPTEMSNDSPPEDQGSLYFTIQEELDFDQRYSEGCGIPDNRYESWLRVNHPEQFRQGNKNVYVCDSSTHTQRVMEVPHQMTSWRVMSSGICPPSHLNRSRSMPAGLQKDLTCLMNNMKRG